MADDPGPAPLQPGDLCHHGSNLLPTYRVIWIDDGKAWLRDVNTGQDAVVAIGRCHKLGADLSRIASADAEADSSYGPTGPLWPDGTPRP